MAITYNYDTMIMLISTYESETSDFLSLSLQNGISDIFNGFIVDAEILPPVLNPPSTDGNPTDPFDYGGFPVVSTTGVTSVQVHVYACTYCAVSKL